MNVEQHTACERGMTSVLRVLSMAVLFALSPVAAHAQHDDGPPRFVTGVQDGASSVPPQAAPLPSAARTTTSEAEGSASVTVERVEEAPPAAATAQSAAGSAATGSAQAGVAATASGGTGGGTRAAAIDLMLERQDAESAAEPDEIGEVAASRRARVANTWFGPAGGIRVVDAGSGAPASVRLQLAADMFTASNQLLAGDQNDYFGGTLSLGVTVIEHLELYGSIHSHANGNALEAPQLLQVLGDAVIGAKGYYAPLPYLTVGGDLRLVFLNSIGGLGPVFAGTGVGLRGLISADLRELPEDAIPLILRGSLDYYFDNSSELIEGVEAARYANIPGMRRRLELEDRHLIRRVERFALNINRVDMLTLALGVEVPLLVHGTEAQGFHLHPILEWSLGVPVNRQGYSCLLMAVDSGPGDPDGCLEVEGIAAMPSTLTLGVRAYAPDVPVSLLLGFDIGLSGTSNFVRELAPNRPWAFLIALSYAVDESPRKVPPPAVVERAVLVTKAPPERPRIDGVAVDAQTGAGIEGVVVRYVDHAFTAQSTDAAGRFLSYPMPAGPIRLALSHPSYEPAECSVDVPEPAPSEAAPAVAPSPAGPSPAPAAEPSGTGEMRSDGITLNPYLYAAAPSDASAGTAEAPIESPTESPTVSLRCELRAKPRAGAVRGTVASLEGKPVIAAEIQLIGPANRVLTSDSLGQFSALDLPAGNYSVRVEAGAYLLKMLNVDITPGGQASLHVELLAKPKQAQVELTQQEVRIRKQIFFKSNSAEISERSDALLTEIADVLLRNPQVTSVEVQGHTDNLGNSALNLQLSQDRADAVRSWLVQAGVAGSRLTAKGYGDTRPLMPNITDAARARNRRVQFILR